VLKGRRVRKWVSGIKISIHIFIGSLNLKLHIQKVAHKESTLETTVVEGCVFHELTFSWKIMMLNTVTAESMKISIQVSCELTFQANVFPRCDAIYFGPPPEDSAEMLQSKWPQASRST